MRIHLISGGCGFVGRNMARRIISNSKDHVLIIDDLSIGESPSKWFKEPLKSYFKDLEVYGEEGRLFFLKQDFRIVLQRLLANENYFQDEYALNFTKFEDVFHFAAIVGGRAMIEGDPLKVALDLSIDAEFFYWLSRYKPSRVLYPSSSAAYPIHLQSTSGSVSLSENDIDFSNLGAPDMTYGWSKLTGEYLAKIAAKDYGIKVTCIRPFSGYGEDQDHSYPIPAITKRIVNRENPVEVWGTGKQGRDFVHIEDILDCIEIAMEKVSDGSAINIGSGKLSTFLEIIDILSTIAGYKPEINCLLDKPVGVFSRYGNITWVKENLGWEAKIDIQEGLRRVYDHLKIK